jgi:hypothetical protein
MNAGRLRHSRAVLGRSRICRDSARFVVLPIALGATIYLIFRSPHLLVFRWLRAAGLLETTMQVREYFAAVRLPDAVLYSLPDGLWVYAATSSMLLIWRGSPPVCWLLAGVVLAVGGEIGQALSFVPGTYEHLDILAYLAGFTLALSQLRHGHDKAHALPRGVVDNDLICLRQRRHE